jgi:hypothetical protein
MVKGAADYYAAAVARKTTAGVQAAASLKLKTRRQATQRTESAISRALIG